MVEYDRRLDTTFASLSHPLRRQMLNLLRDGPMRVTELARPFAVSLAASSKHIAVLENAGLINRTVVGRDHQLALDGRPLADAEQWMGIYRRFWSERLDALDDHLRGSRR